MVIFYNVTSVTDFDPNEAAELIKKGKVVVYPTETLYGLGGDALNENTVDEIFKMKGRGPHIPIPVVISDREMLDVLVSEIDDLSLKLMDSFWPGPLTIILKARQSIPANLTAGSGYIGVRVPSSEIALKLVRAAGSPLTATSANASGHQPCTEPREILKQLTKQPAMFVDAGVLPVSPPSTVVDARYGKIRILRQGAISENAILKALTGAGD